MGCILAICSVFLIITSNKLKTLQINYENLQNGKEENLNERSKELLKQIDSNNNQFNLLQERIRNLQLEHDKISNQIKDSIDFNNELVKSRQEELDCFIENERSTKKALLLQEIKDWYNLEIERTQNEIKEWTKNAQDAASFSMESVLTDIKGYNELLDRQKALLDDYNEKVKTIQEEILRQRAIEENETFYTVQLDDNSIHDISLLEEIRNKLTKTDLLNKLIYDNYISKPVNEMIKRVLSGRAPCGIYKITRLKTGEIYIGKSTDIKARWQQHAKSAFHCGTISHSLLHTTMERDGIQNFSWELLEELPKDKIGEREKYWIDFYNTKQYGLNQREG